MGFSSNSQGVLDDLDMFLFLGGGEVEAGPKILVGAMNLLAPLLHVINRKIICVNIA